MVKPTSVSVSPLENLGVLQIQGRDYLQFLQGQLSNDVRKLTQGNALLAGLHNPQGRVVALLRLTLLASDTVLAILPRELIDTVMARLQRYVLRAKVTLSDVSDAWQIWGVCGTPSPNIETEGLFLALPDSKSGPRGWLLQKKSEALKLQGTPLSFESWHRLDIAAELPQVFAATSELFVAQMLNLDTWDGIAFDKGCYTGQEVIARAHYRGQVKRRMQRTTLHDSRDLKPGDSGTLPDGRSYRIVDAIRNAVDQWDVLAVYALNLTQGADAETE